MTGIRSILVKILLLWCTVTWGGEETGTWQVYTNAKYGYEIRYPEGLVVFPTGPERERDGANIRVAIKDYAAPAPVLDIQIHPKTTPANFPLMRGELKDLSVDLKETILNGIPARVARFHWKSNGRLAFSEIYLDGVVFHFTAASADNEMIKESEWWAIVSSFRFNVNTDRGNQMDLSKIKDFATRYTAAWCSQDPARVASFFAESGSLKINNGAPSVGRVAITAAAQSFMTAFPDMVVKMDRLERKGDTFLYHWTLIGTNTGPGGTGNRVEISGYEEWTMGEDGLIAKSLGHFDEAEYQRQLAPGSDKSE